MPFSWIFQGGKLKQEITSVTLVNNTALVVDITVPARKRWLLIGIKVMNPDNVTRNIYVTKYKEAAKTNLIKEYVRNGVLTLGRLQYPSYSTAVDSSPSIPLEFLDGGNTIEITWATGGASAGGTDADGLVVEYLEIDW